MEGTEAKNVNPYHGHGLGRPSEEIRLLKLLPGSSDTEIICETTVVCLADCERYTALSYTWGDPDDRLPITLNGIPDINVTRNLYVALQHLRDADQALAMWIDALCINQADRDEMSNQVQIMGDIYKKAAQTVIWLGEEAGNSDLAMDIVRQLDGSDLGSSRNNPDAAGMAALVALQQRPYWSRVWIIQGMATSMHT